MNATALRVTTVASTEVDNRAAYLGFAFAYVFGHGAALLSKSGAVLMPSWLPIGLLATGLLMRHGLRHDRVAACPASGFRSAATSREARRDGLAHRVHRAGVSGHGREHGVRQARAPGRALARRLTIVVGLIYIAEGAIRGNALHYNLGTWLMLVAAATLFIPGAGFFGTLAVLGGGAYLLAAFLERRRLAA